MNVNKKKYTILDTIRIPFKCNCQLSALIALLAVAVGVVPTVQTIAVAKFIDISLEVINRKASIQDVIPWILLIIFLIAFLWFSQIIGQFLQLKLQNKLRETFRVSLTEKRSKLQYYNIEDSKTWDLITRVSDKSEERLKDAYCRLFDFIALVIRIIGLIVLLVTRVWWVALIVVIFSIPTIIFSVKSGKHTYDVRQKTQQFHRRYEYLADILSNREAAEERNLFGYGEREVNSWHYYYEKARKIEVNVKLKWYTKMKLGGITTSFILILVTFALISPVQAGNITIGEFMSLINSTFLLVDSMTWSLTRYVEQIANNAVYMKDLTEFSHLSEIDSTEFMKTSSKNIFESLEFKNVRFKYPGTESYILDGLSFTIRKEKRYAIVGINGAGKTTITKLITGLYDTYEGNIYLNGNDIKNYSKTEINTIFSSVYQDYAKYYISIRENIKLGNLQRMDDEDNLKEIIQEVGLSNFISSLPDGVDTKLGKIYKDGQDISGGQWQRIALARTLYSSSPVFILDEPTSALDPVSETTIYQEFDSMSKGKTTIFISHRLSSTKLADEIIVLNSGKMQEFGSHNKLMSQKGLYYDMFESQRNWYEK